MLCHLDSGYNLARWLMANDQDASDALQNAAIKAYKDFGKFRGTEPKSWFLAIVRNECMNSLRRRNRTRANEWSLENGLDDADSVTPNPESLALQQCEHDSLREAIDALPGPQREAILLREIEDLSYQEIADITGTPIGTVMSRLARARAALQGTLGKEVPR